VNNLLIRPAVPEDAQEISRVLVSSIRDLCDADHHNAPDAVAGWLANKTPGLVGNMICSGGIIVALQDNEIVGVGATGKVDAATKTGRITLNYVSPAFRFKGISRALLSVLEAQLVLGGARLGVLTSTITAHRFYLSAGWEDTGFPQPGPRVAEYQMQKHIT